MTRRRGVLVSFVVLASAAPALAEPRTELRSAVAPQFRVFQDFQPGAQWQTFSSLNAVSRESLVRLPGDADSVLSLGGPGPSGQPRLRIAVEVNEVAPKLLPPDPQVDASDTRSRAGGDWKPIDAIGRPYQLRVGARLIW